MSWLVITTDLAGCSFDVKCKSFDSALARVRASARRYQRDVIAVYGPNADGDGDGLTFDQWEAVQAAIEDERGS